MLVFFGILLNLYFAILVHFKSEKNTSKNIFELTIYAICGWCLSMLFYRISNSSAEIWARLLYFFPTFIPTGFFLFGLYFPNNYVKRSVVLLILLINCLMAILTLLPGAVIKEILVPRDGEKIISFGWAYYYFYIFYIPIFFTASYVELIVKFRRSTDVVRAQIMTILVGLLIASSVGMVTNLILPTLGVFDANWAGQFFTFIWVGSATYAILKHGFLNIKVLATQLFVVIILLILLARLLTFTTPANFILDLAILVLVSIFSVLVVNSVMGEVKQKEKLEELTQKLKDLDQQKNEFISMAAHELRAPMTAIKGYISMILEGDTGDIPEKARGFLADATSINDRMVRLVNNMLNVSRIEEGRMSFQFDTDELSRVVRTVYSQFLPEAQRKNLEYKLDISKEIKDRVHADIDKLHEIAGNLISNAIKYTETGSVVVKLVQKDAGTIRFEVVDTGPGISSEEQGKLFQKFYRVESNVGKTTGTGLGLYISRLMIEKFNGKIGLDSEPGRGSTFWFELPVVA